MEQVDAGYTELRDYQHEMKHRLYEKWWGGSRSVMVQMPTGTGKTFLMAAVVRENAADGVLVVTHRIELVEQISETLSRFGVRHGVIAGGRKAWSAENVRVASIQTLSRCIDSLSFCPSVVVVDEAHHALAKTYRILWEKWPEALFLGLTATPCRLSGEPFTDLFEVLLQAWSMERFIDEGWLADFEYISADPNSKAVRRVGLLSKRGANGDYQLKEMATVMDCPESIRHLYNTYQTFASGKKGIVYAINREHARHIVEYYRKGGVSCCMIDAKTPPEERRSLVEDYRNGRITLMVNVDIFSEGWDVPEVEVIQLARPTLSLAKYLQQVGRGMRVSCKKSHVMILDQVGLYLAFGMPIQKWDWQRMFEGRQAGRSVTCNTYPIYIGEEAMEKQLVNLEMVRIKRKEEKREGMEVFMQGGKYGIALDGKEVCAPQFTRIERLPEPYFALCFYPYDAVFRGKVTVVDAKGRDLRPELYGKVECKGDFFKGYDFAGKQVYWDSKTRRFYERMPELGRLGRFELVKQDAAYMFRFRERGLDFSFRKEDVQVCATEKVFIIGKHLIVNDKKEQFLYEFLGFSKGMILVKLPGQNVYRLILDSGNRFCDFKPPYPGTVTRTPDRMYIRFHHWPGF